ncbi:MAG: winged helix-turn-helix transcriptional regulator [Candidatus Rokubacteria bacterium]|nr:winged helix-turn-helix transcriptional regulator [Candidatus Rokubacteria bacterium]
MCGPPPAAAEQAVRWFQALGDETRLRIIERLRAGEESVGNLAGVLASGQSRLSFHLRTLKSAGLVRARRQGRLTYYSLDFATLHAVEQILETLRLRPDAPADRNEASAPEAELP